MLSLPRVRKGFDTHTRTQQARLHMAVRVSGLGFETLNRKPYRNA